MTLSRKTLSVMRNEMVVLLRLASRLTGLERAVMKECILSRDPLLIQATKDAQSADDLVDQVLHIVLSTLADRTYNDWGRVFVGMSTDKGKQLAKTAQPSHDNSLTYGEVDFFSLASILELARPQPGQIFVDLGHGTGRAIIAAALRYGTVLKECRGVECVSPLVAASRNALNRYEQIVSEMEHLYGSSGDRCRIRLDDGDILKLKPGDIHALLQTKLKHTEDGDITRQMFHSADANKDGYISEEELCLCLGSVLDVTSIDVETTRDLVTSLVHSNNDLSDRRVNYVEFLSAVEEVTTTLGGVGGEEGRQPAAPAWHWTQGDIVFVNSTAFTPDLMEGISRLSQHMPLGAVIVTLTKQLDSRGYHPSHLTLTLTKQFAMSWGPATAFFYTRVDQSSAS